jgi:peptidoglycan hydrolase-like protein with peptidoglycan-binding domain
MERSTYKSYPSQRRRRRKRSRWPWVALALLVLVAAAGLIAVAVAWPTATIGSDDQALASVKVAPALEHARSVTVTDSNGHPVPARIRAGKIVPLGQLASGEKLDVTVTVRRSSLVGWLVGGNERVKATIVTPMTGVRSTLLHLATGAPVDVHLRAPASVVVLKLPGYKQQRLEFAKPRQVVQTGIHATGPNRFGVLVVSTAARPWEKLSAPEHVSWFPAGTRLEALVKPAPGATIEPSTPIELTLSEPVASVLGKVRPTLDPATPGTWVQTAPNQLTFKPSGAGYPLGKHVVLTLPTSTDLLAPGGTQTVHSLTWAVPVGSTLRLQQLLAELGYLPLTWAPASGADAGNALEQKQAALNAPQGKFEWRYSNTPAELQSLWKPGGWTRMTQAAVMAFQHDHSLVVDGIPGPVVWHTLIKAALDHDRVDSYSYVLVHRTVPQTLTLWNNGDTIMQVKINTGVPGAPTPYGTHPVFEHIPIGTMSGRNPDGTHYHDPGIKWISYFNGGEAIHGFNRPTYGFPQSVGCVEAPIDTAAKIWPYTPIGTLVTIVP